MKTKTFRILRDIVLFSFIVIEAFFLGGMFGQKYTVGVITEQYTKDTDLFIFGRSENVSCVSDSMGLFIPCGVSVISEPVSLIQEGKIYIYERGNQTIIHRLVKCLDKDCNQTIFKGDNNYIADPIVNKTQIIRIVTYVKP